MQQGSYVSGKHRRRGLKIPIFNAAALIAILLLSGIPAAHGKRENNPAQFPDAPIQVTSPDFPSFTETLEALKRGVDCYADKRYEAALEILPGEQAAKASLLGDYIFYYRAKSNFMVGGYRQALDAFGLLQKHFPESPLIQDVLREQCEVLLKLNDAKAALAAIGHPKIEQNADTLYLKAKAHREAGEKEAAIELLLRIYSRYPGSKASQSAEKDLLSLSPGAFSGSRHYGIRLQRAENLLKGADARAARALLLALGRVSAPDRASGKKRNLLLAEAEYRLGRNLTALTYLRKVTAADPELHAKAIYLEGACHRRLKNEAALLTARDRALKLYPLSPDTEELCYSVAAYFELNYEFGKAREAYRILHRAFPKGRRAERALWQLALYAYLAAEFGDAARGFWNYARAYPNALAASSAMYWMGRCYGNLGDFARAKYLFTRTHALAGDGYYGQRARESAAALRNPLAGKPASVSGIDFNQVIRIGDGIQHPPLSIPKPGGDGASIAERARILAAAGLPEFAISELRWGSRRYPHEENALGYLMSRIHESGERFAEAIACLRKIFPDHSVRPRDSLPGEVWQLLYPVRHWETISSQAAKMQTDPILILAIIRQESGFEPKAQSPANARGLMQIIPATGRRLAEKARIAQYNDRRLFEAETSIILGTQHLASLLQRYGKVEPALAAYNAGSSRAAAKTWRSLWSASLSAKRGTISSKS